MFTFEWDQKALNILKNFSYTKRYMSSFMNSLSKTLAKEAENQIKPNLDAKAEWNGSKHGTGNLRNSLMSKVLDSGEGFDITFESLFYGIYMDVGNGDLIMPTSSDTLTVGARNDAGPITFAKQVGGVGSFTPGLPTHFSDKTVAYLDTNMHQFTDKFIGDLLRKMVK